MGSNQAAANSLIEQHAPVKKTPGSSVDTNLPEPSNVQPSPQDAGQSPLGVMNAQQMTPPEDPVQRYNRDAAINKIVSSPDMMDAVTRLKLRNHYLGKSDDGLGAEALGIIQSSMEK
jgi:hypothetical protein